MTAFCTVFVASIKSCFEQVNFIVLNLPIYSYNNYKIVIIILRAVKTVEKLFSDWYFPIIACLFICE